MEIHPRRPGFPLGGRVTFAEWSPDAGTMGIHAAYAPYRGETEFGILDEVRTRQSHADTTHSGHDATIAADSRTRGSGGDDVDQSTEGRSHTRRIAQVGHGHPTDPSGFPFRLT